MKHGPTSTRPVQVSLTVETEEGLAVERRPQAQRLGSWCTICIPTVGTGLVTQTKKKELVSEQRPQAQRLGSWCTVASFKLANVSSRRRRKGSPRIDAQKPNALDPGVQSHPSSWHVSHQADRGRACLVSTPTHTKRWKFGSRCCHTHWFSDFAFRTQLKGEDCVDPCELTHVATSTSRSTHAHVRIILSYDTSAEYIEYFMSYVKKWAGDSNSSVQFSLCSRQFVVPGGDIFGAHGRTRGTLALDTRAIISQRQATLILRSRFMVQ